jgi:hypothetical protein
MNIEFELLDVGLQSVVFHSKNFPEYIRFQVGDRVWLEDFEEYLSKGRLYCPQIEECMEMEEVDSLDCVVDSLEHGIEKSVGYILKVWLKQQ